MLWNKLSQNKRANLNKLNGLTNEEEFKTNTQQHFKCNQRGTFTELKAKWLRENNVALLPSDKMGESLVVKDMFPMRCQKMMDVLLNPGCSSPNGDFVSPKLEEQAKNDFLMLENEAQDTASHSSFHATPAKAVPACATPTSNEHFFMKKRMNQLIQIVATGKSGLAKGKRDQKTATMTTKTLHRQKC